MSGGYRINRRSMPAISNKRNRYISQPSRQDNEEEQDKDKNQFKPHLRPYQKLPMLRIGKILKKMGVMERRQMYVPNEMEQSLFLKSKWEQLKRQYSPSKSIVKRPFQGQLDQLVLNCWNYGDNNDSKTVWKKYRQNCDDLTFDTLKLIKRR